LREELLVTFQLHKCCGIFFKGIVCNKCGLSLSDTMTKDVFINDAYREKFIYGICGRSKKRKVSQYG
jgi:hypothetical protein